MNKDTYSNYFWVIVYKEGEKKNLAVGHDQLIVLYELFKNTERSGLSCSDPATIIRLTSHYNTDLDAFMIF